MRIYFTSMTLPKKAAKRIQKYFKPNPLIRQPLTLYEAQAITASMLGYENWHTLEKITKSAKHEPSPLDENSSVDTQEERIAFQTKVLVTLYPFLCELHLRKMALKFRVSAKTPRSIKLALIEDYRKNSLFYCEPLGGEPEWRFEPSGRSEEVRLELYDILNNFWRSEKKSLTDYLNQLSIISTEQPENIVPYLYSIEALTANNLWEKAKRQLELLEKAILESIPPNYPMKRKAASVNWYVIENRDYLRSLYHLGLTFYALGNYKKSKQWFLFLTRCSSREIEYEIFFLRDLRQPSPEGDLHLLDGKDMVDRYIDRETGKFLT